MASRLAPAELAARIAEGKLSKVKNPDGSVTEWFPAMAFDDGQKVLAIDRAGRWAWTADLKDAGQYHGFQEPAIVGALPLLECDPDSLVEELMPVAAIVGVSVEQVIQSLPGQALLECAFGTRSDYWIERALAWAERSVVRGLPRAALQSVVDDLQVRQDLRHRAARLIALGGRS